MTIKDSKEKYTHPNVSVINRFNNKEEYEIASQCIT